jgi:hypothetical protein
MPHAGNIQSASLWKIDGRSGGQSRAADYADFVILGRRRDRRSIEISVYTSPAGAMPEPEVVSFTLSESKRIHDSFYSSLAPKHEGRYEINQTEATTLGKRLTAVLLPASVFQLLAQSLAQVARAPHGALRIRLAMDAELTDLPWEYVYRPDRVDSDGLSGFLLLDPKISMLRELPNPRVTIEPITGQERLHFIGALWEGLTVGRYGQSSIYYGTHLCRSPSISRRRFQSRMTKKRLEKAFNTAPPFCITPGTATLM